MPVRMVVVVRVVGEEMEVAMREVEVVAEVDVIMEVPMSWLIMSPCVAASTALCASHPSFL